MSAMNVYPLDRNLLHLKIAPFYYFLNLISPSEAAPFSLQPPPSSRPPLLLGLAKSGRNDANRALAGHRELREFIDAPNEI